MRFNDAITGAVLVVFALAEIAYTRTFPSLHGQSYGPDLFPRLIGLGLFACGCILILRGLRARRVNSQPSPDAVASWFDSSNIVDSKHAKINVALTIFFLLVYIFLSDWIGFIPLSLIINSTLLYRLGSSLVMAVVIAILTTIVIQILFAKVLLVPLPAGWLGAGTFQSLVW